MAGISSIRGWHVSSRIDREPGSWQDTKSVTFRPLEPPLSLPLKFLVPWRSQNSRSKARGFLLFQTINARWLEHFRPPIPPRPQPVPRGDQWVSEVHQEDQHGIAWGHHGGTWGVATVGYATVHGRKPSDMEKGRETYGETMEDKHIFLPKTMDF